MDREIWNHQQWILRRLYPKGVKRYIGFIVSCIGLLVIVISNFRYPIYHTFYGYVKESNKNVVTIFIPIDELDEFSKAIEENQMQLQSVDSEIQYLEGKNVMKAEVIVSISEKLLVENNIVIIRVKVKDVSIYEELSQKWKRGMSNERNKPNQIK